MYHKLLNSQDGDLMLSAEDIRISAPGKPHNFKALGRSILLQAPFSRSFTPSGDRSSCFFGEHFPLKSNTTMKSSSMCGGRKRGRPPGSSNNHTSHNRTEPRHTEETSAVKDEMVSTKLQEMKNKAMLIK